MMKKLFFSKECIRKRCARIAAMTAGLVMAVSLCMPVHAASKSGTIVGYPCYATLAINGNSATTTTNSSISAYHYAEVEYRYYYTDSNNKAQIGTATAQNSNSRTVSATAYAQGSNISKISAKSTNTIHYGDNTWSVTLNE